MKRRLRLLTIWVAVAIALPSTGCSFLFLHTTFQPEADIKFSRPSAELDALVINNRKSWLAFGPPLVPVVPWPAGEIPQLSLWSRLTVGVFIVNRTEPLTIDFSDAALIIDQKRGPPAEIEENCDGATQDGMIVRLAPRSSRCIIYLDFRQPPEKLDDFELVVGKLAIASERHLLPTTRYSKRSTLDYRPFALPLF